MMLVLSVITFHGKAAKGIWRTVVFRAGLIWGWVLGWLRRRANLAKVLTSLRPHFSLCKDGLLVWNHKGPRRTKTISGEKNKARDNTIPDLKIYHRAMVIEGVGHWTCRPGWPEGVLRNTSMYIWPTDLWQGCREQTMRIPPKTLGTLDSHRQRNDTGPHLIPYTKVNTKINTKWMQDLHIRHATLKRKNTDDEPHDAVLGNTSWVFIHKNRN